MAQNTLPILFHGCRRRTAPEHCGHDKVQTLLRFMRNEENVSIWPFFNGREAVTRIPTKRGNIHLVSLYLLFDQSCDYSFTYSSNECYLQLYLLFTYCLFKRVCSPPVYHFYTTLYLFQIKYILVSSLVTFIASLSRLLNL